MPIATELNVDTSATAMDMANAMFGNGISITSASFTGAGAASGTYTGGLSTLGSLTQSDTGVILSTGNATDFTNSSGTTDTNTATGTSTNHTGVGEVDGDTDLNAVSGQATEDGAFFDATFVATGDLLTMQFVFTSEEYLEYVNGGVNDAMGIWVNGTYVPLTLADNSTQNVTIDTINDGVNSNLYLDNPVTADTYNTEMDGGTVVLSIVAPVNAGQSNTIRIGIGDGGDSAFDSNLLIMGNSIQTISIAESDQLEQLPNATQIHDILANDINIEGNALTITHLNNIAVNVNDTITLPSGEQLTLNPDMTITVLSDGDIGTNSFTYSTIDTAGNVSTGLGTIETTLSPQNYIVEGTSGADSIDGAYLGDPEGDIVDNSDYYDGSNRDSVEAGAGADTVNSGDGADTVRGEAGDDLIYGDNYTALDAGDLLDGGAGNDTIYGGGGRDMILGGAGADSLFGEIGNDTVFGGDGSDTISGGAGDDVLDGDDATATAGADSIDGAAGNDEIIGDEGNDTLIGGTGNDTIYAGNDDDIAYGDEGQDQLFGGAGDDSLYGGDDADSLYGEAGGDFLSGGAGDDYIDGGIDGDDIDGGAGNDTVLGGTGNDNIDGNDGADSLQGGSGADSIWGDAGDDYIDGGDDGDALYGGAGADEIIGGSGGDFISVDSGADTVSGGADADNIVVAAGAFADGTVVTVDGGSTATTGADNDTLNLSSWASYANLTQTNDPDANSTSGSVDVTDGAGNTITVNFTEIEALILPSILDYIVEGTAGNDLIDGSYLLDPEGDRVDNSDHSDGSNDDRIEAGDGDDTILGGSGADSIYAGTGNDTVYDETDVASTSDTSADFVDLGDGNDVFIGTGLGPSDQDTIFGGAGNDTISVRQSYDTVFGGDGDDLITSEDELSVYGDWLSGDAGNDTIIGANTDDTILGGTGDDSIQGGGSGDIIDGGTGDDTILADDLTATGANLIVNGSFEDTTGMETRTWGFVAPGGSVSGWTDANGSSIEFVNNGRGGLLATEGNNWLDTEGLAGQNLVISQAVAGVSDGEVYALRFDAGDLVDAHDGTALDNQFQVIWNGEVIASIDPSDGSWTSYEFYLTGGSGDGSNTLTFVGSGQANAQGASIDNVEMYELIQGAGGDDSVLGDLGDDVIVAGAGEDTVRGGMGNDSILGNSGNDSIYGNEGDDTILGGAGNDSIYGETGNDYVSGGVGDDSLEGNEGADTIIGGAGNDWVRGSFGNDSIEGNEGDDFLWGGYGDDTIVFADNFGDDTVEGEEAQETDGDTIDLSGITSDLTIDLTSANPEAGSFTDGTDTVSFVEIENIVLGSGADTLVLGTGSGDDRVEGFTIPTAGGGGTYTGVDLLDVSTLLDINGAPVNTDDVVITTDVNGDAVLTFPSGESLTLVGVTAASINDPAILEAMGIPQPDYIVEGTGAGELIDGSYIGDPEGDIIDGLDNASGTNADSVVAGAGDDTVQSFAGNDSIDAGTGNDSVDAGDGDDNIVGGGGNDTLQGWFGDDSLTGDDGDDSLIGWTGNDTLAGGIGADSIEGGDDQDVIILEDAFGQDTIDGGDGGATDFDTLDMSALTVDTTVDLTSANPEAGSVTAGADIASFVDIENIVLGGGTDTIVLADGSGSDTVNGFEAPTDLGGGNFTGNDQIDVSGMTDASGSPVNVADVTVTDTNGDGTGDAILSFPNGESITLVGVDPADVTSHAQLAALGIPGLNYVVEGTGGDDTIDAGYTGDPEGDMVDNLDAVDGSNDDTISAGAGNDSVVAGFGDDTIFAGAGIDTVAGGDGNDSIFGEAGNDVLNGGAGNDTVSGGGGNDSILGDIGADSLSGGSGDDTVNGGTGDDWVNGNDGNDTVYGGEGNDSVFGAEGNDVMFGEDGADSMEGWLGDDTMSGGTGNDYLDGADGDDLLVGDDGNDTLLGGNNGGADTLIGGVGNDYLSAGDGDDLLQGGSGDDQMIGAEGQDTFSLDDSFGMDTISGGSGGIDFDQIDASNMTTAVNLTLTVAEGGTLVSGADTASFDDIELFSLGSGNDTVTGGVGNENVVLGLGDDFAEGGAGNDTLAGSEGDDTLSGGAGADELSGGDGNDSISVNENDTASGGDGDDYFEVLPGSEVGAGTINIVGGEGAETLGDTLDFNGLIGFGDITYTNTDPGVGGGMSGFATLGDGTVVNFDEIENVIICFTEGTRIATPRGVREIEDLEIGDLVVTRDHGLQPIRWVGKRTVPARGALAPIRFDPHVIGNERALYVSPQHRMLMQGVEASLLFGESEVLASAKHLVNGSTVTEVHGGTVTYVHIMFDQHEIIYAEGAASESFYPGGTGLNAVEEEAREELFSLFPELRSHEGAYGDTARLCLKAHESRLLRLG